MSFLFGSAPSSSTTWLPDIAQPQLQLLDQLSQLLQGGGQPPGVTPLQGPFAASASPLQLTSLAGLENIAQNAPTGASASQDALTGASTDALYKLLTKGAPQIDATDVIQKSVIDPLMQQWNQRILPSVIGKYAGSAGGTYSSDAEKARQSAASDLETNIANAAGNLGFQAAQANQNATLSGLNTALWQTPSIASLPSTLQGENANLLYNLLQAGGVPYSIAEQQITGGLNAQLNTQQQTQQKLADLIAAFSPQTLQSNTTVSGGSSGLLPSLLGGLAGNSGLGTALGSWIFG